MWYRLSCTEQRTGDSCWRSWMRKWWGSFFEGQGLIWTRNKDIRGTAHVFEVKWERPIWDRDCTYIGREVLRMEQPGRRPRGRPKRRQMDIVKQDMKLVAAREDDAEDRAGGWQLSLCWGKKEAESRSTDVAVKPLQTLNSSSLPFWYLGD